ncbi:hypothetical protein Tco_1505154 [Tanacetum coccineum]
MEIRALFRWIRESQIAVPVQDQREEESLGIPITLLKKRLFHEGRIVTPSFIAENNMLPFFQAIGSSIHEHVMDPLDISRNPSTEKGKKIASPLVISSSSSSSDDNEVPSFLEFYDELSESEDLTKVQREKRGIKKSLSPPQAPSKSISSKSTHYTTSSSPSESPTPTHVAPPPKLRFVIPINLEPQELPPLQVSPNAH